MPIPVQLSLKLHLGSGEVMNRDAYKCFVQMPSAVLCWKCKRNINTPQNAVPWRMQNLNLQELEPLSLLLDLTEKGQ